MKGLIYRIIHRFSDAQYIGATTQSLKERWGQHISNSKKEGVGQCEIQKMMNEQGNEQFTIILIKEYEVVDKRHLYAYEQLWINKLTSINRNNPNPFHPLISFQKKEYALKNIDKVKERRRSYYQKNKEKIKAKSAEYYENNKNSDEFKLRQTQYAEKRKKDRKEYMKQYYERNKEKQQKKAKEKIKCEYCDLFITRNNLSRHIKKCLA